MVDRHGMIVPGRTRFGARMWLNLAEPAQVYTYFFGIWERTITAYLKYIVLPGDVAIDIGAKAGYFTLLLSTRVGPAGRVYAVEAAPDCIGALCDNLALNEARNVWPIFASVATETIAAGNYQKPGDDPDGTRAPGPVLVRKMRRPDSLSVTPLTDPIPEAAIVKARVIRIDLGAGAVQVLNSIAPLLPRLSPGTEILISLRPGGHTHHDGVVGSLIDLFDGTGFQPYAIESHNGIDGYLRGSIRGPCPLVEAGPDPVAILFRHPRARRYRTRAASSASRRSRPAAVARKELEESVI